MSDETEENDDEVSLAEFYQRFPLLALIAVDILRGKYRVELEVSIDEDYEGDELEDLEEMLAARLKMRYPPVPEENGVRDSERFYHVVQAFAVIKAHLDEHGDIGPVAACVKASVDVHALHNIVLWLADNLVCKHEPELHQLGVDVIKAMPWVSTQPKE